MNRTVLVLDDSLTVRMDLADAFADAGCHTLAAATAAEARALLLTHGVDIIILDVQLPDADGVEFLQELRANPATADVVVMMLSTAAAVPDHIRGLRTGADEYVGKPYDTGYVVSKSQELSRRRRAPLPASTTVLIIDDSPTFREAMSSACRQAGYRVLSTGTGDEGLRLAAAQRPAAIVVDNILPDIDGETVVRRLRLDAALRGVPCLLLTGADDHEAELRAFDAGADGFVRKTDDIGLVLVRLAALLRGVTSPTPVEDTRSLSGPKKILAVDDSPTYVHGLADLLRHEGYDVVMARSGEEALDLLAVQDVDCILLDLLMPGLGGHETCRRIKADPDTRDTPVIMLTSFDDRAAMVGALAVGADDYVQKSSEFEVLTARVRAQIRRRQFEDENQRIRDELLQGELAAVEARAAAQIAETRAALVGELERKNQELEAFSYSVSHDLRAPLRSIDGFSRALLEDCGEQLGPVGTAHLGRVRAATARMAELIDDLLALSKVGRAEIRRQRIDLTAVAQSIVATLAERHPGRTVAPDIQPDLVVEGDERLLRAALENLFENAWKFTSGVPDPSVTFASRRDGHRTVYFVQDNGSGFDMRYVDKLFRPFQRLHLESEFPGTGIGLATVRRIIERHGGEAWAEGVVGQGATVSFTVPEPESDPAARNRQASERPLADSRVPS